MDLFTPGPGGPEQVHDFTPGVLPNGVFWTTAIHPNSFVVRKHSAQLNLRDLPLCDTFVFGNCEGVSSSVSCWVQWKATTGRKRRGEGAAAPADSPGAFKGSLSDASCTATVSGRQTGFGFWTVDKLDASGFYANFGEQRNGIWL